MQNNGLVKLFAVLFVLVSIYQLSFTFIVNRTEDNARAYSLEKVDENSPNYFDALNATERQYLDSVSTDQHFGYANAKVRELNKGLDLKGGINVILQISVKDILKGLAENTLVIYTSDQGFFLGEHGWFDKRFMYEESMSTPLVIRYPNVIKAGQVNSRLVQNLDFAPTFVDLAGLSVPKEMQGLSLKPLLNGDISPLKAAASHDWRTSLYYQYFEYPVPHSVMPHYGVRSETHKLIHFTAEGKDFWELYDLEADPSELKNQYHEAGFEQIKADLHQQLIALRKQYQVND